MTNSHGLGFTPEPRFSAARAHHSLRIMLEWRVKVNKQEIAMSKAQKGNKEKKKPKADKNQPKTHVSAYKAAQGQGKPSFNPFARKT
jgi:hypothetical protein